MKITRTTDIGTEPAGPEDVEQLRDGAPTVPTPSTPQVTAQPAIADEGHAISPAVDMLSAARPDQTRISDRRSLSALGMTRARRLVLVLVSTILSTVALVLVGPASPAAADTKSCQLYGGGNFSGTWIPSGTYCLTRVGGGTWVSGVQGEWYGPKLCNYEVTAEFFNRDWGYRGPTRYSSRNYGCAYGSTWMPYIRVNNSIQGLTGTPSGYLCSTLRVAGQKVTSSCQYIY